MKCLNMKCLGRKVLFKLLVVVVLETRLGLCFQKLDNFFTNFFQNKVSKIISFSGKDKTVFSGKNKVYDEKKR